MSFCKSHDKIRQMFAKDILYTYAYLEGTFALHNDKGKQSNFALKQIFLTRFVIRRCLEYVARSCYGRIIFRNLETLGSL